MSDTAKMTVCLIGFGILMIATVITRSIFLSYILVAIVSAFTASLLTEPYKVVTVKPKYKSIEVKEIRRN